MTQRVEGWEKLLDDAISDALVRPYVLGEHDCFKLACNVRAALTGVDRWSEFEGRYKTQREAERLLAAHGRTFELAMDWFFDAPNVPAASARRGDVCCVLTEDGVKHLGICIGKHVALLAAHGLEFHHTLGSVCAWRIGE